MSDPGARRHRGRGRQDRGAGWRSHTFADGVCSITLTTVLDAEVAQRLGGRLRELCARGCERLIVDVTGAVEVAGDAPELLAAVFHEHTPACEIVVVTARRSELDGLLPARIAVAWSLSDARRLLAVEAESPGGRVRPSPAGAIGASDRHTLAIRQALRWAAQTAGTGDYENALRGLATIERVEGTLPEGWEERRQAWLLASREQAAQRRRIVTQGRLRPGADGR
jgi:hypothetical protein